MNIPISEIKVDPLRRDAPAADVERLAKSILEIGLLHPITVDQHYVLLAGYHRLEAAKSLGWMDIACNVTSLDGLKAEMASLDENLIRHDFDYLEQGEMLERRKEIYESLHPETRQGQRNGQTAKTVPETVLAAKAFAEDAAEKLHMAPRTIRRRIQIAKNLIPEAKEAVRESGIGVRDALAISSLEPEHQQEAASQLVAGEIHSVSEYHPESRVRGTPMFKSIMADLQDGSKDFRCTPEQFLAEVAAFVDKFKSEIASFNEPYYQAVFSALSQDQRDRFCKQMDSIRQAVKDLQSNMK